MTEANAAGQTNGLPAVIVYQTLSGVIVHITPLSIFTYQAIRDRAEKEFPYPDPTEYRLPVEGAIDPSIKHPASENPVYQALCEPIEQERNQWRIRAAIEVGCTFPGFDDRAAMIEHFRPRLEQLSKVAEMDEDEWQNVLKHCVFTDKLDRQKVYGLIVQTMATPLTPAEVVEGIRYFRLDV